ncbi:hypothetical protein BDV95DRAFT_66408 [Massariosphaeria phaeospora]|uniref:Uncharacterized protein n=1 Tax=Massariosphaeria phaeospora TaxID=100035 RepID=A0A7C8I6Q5_9PLEO|nr:hypothetical protein BDV95DRAFT_66408 [Massariosphaeria phaeospora]
MVVCGCFRCSRASQWQCWMSSEYECLALRQRVLGLVGLRLARIEGKGLKAMKGTRLRFLAHKSVSYTAPIYPAKVTRAGSDSAETKIKVLSAVHPASTCDCFDSAKTRNSNAARVTSIFTRRSRRANAREQSDQSQRPGRAMLPAQIQRPAAVSSSKRY